MRMPGLITCPGGTAVQRLTEFQETRECTPPSGPPQHLTGALHCLRLCIQSMYRQTSSCKWQVRIDRQYE